MVSYLGIDLGGTSVKLGVCGPSGDVRSRASLETRVTAGSDDAMRRIADAARDLVADAGSVMACGVGVPGEIDRSGGLLVRANHFPGWTDVPVVGRLTETLGVPVTLENDANCAAWSEAR